MRYLAISFNNHMGRQRALVGKSESHPENMYWGGGPSHYNWPDSFEVLKDYGVIKDDDERDPHFEYAKDFPPQMLAKIEQGVKVCGFISPLGVLYDCEYGGHSSLADHLGIALYDEDFYRAEEELRQRKWIRVSDVGFLSGDKISKAQITCVQNLAQANEGTDYAKNLIDTLRLFEPFDETMTREEADGCWNRIFAHTESIKSELLDLYERKGWLALGFKNYLAMCYAKLPGKSQGHYYNLLTDAREERHLLAAPDIEPTFAKVIQGLPHTHRSILAELPDTVSRKAALQLAYATAPQITVKGKVTDTILQEAVIVVREIIDTKGSVELDEGVYAANAKLILNHHERVQAHVDRAAVKSASSGDGKRNASAVIVNFAHAKIIIVNSFSNRVTLEFTSNEDVENLKQCYNLNNDSELIVSVVRKGENKAVREVQA